MFDQYLYSGIINYNITNFIIISFDEKSIKLT